jgi:DNA-binding NarL/FixJ family response regulator
VTIRVVVADDQALVRAGFRLILETHDDVEVVGEAADGAEAVDLVADRAPDVVLMDIRMPVLDGIEATRRITAASSARVVILTTFDLDEYVFDGVRAGASGFLLKDVGRDDLLRAVRVVADGDALLMPSATRRLVAEFTRSPSSTADAAVQVDGLTARECDTLAQLARGLSNAEIAVALGVSDATVKTHVAHVLMKLHLRDRVQAVVYAYEHGLVVPPG